MMSLESNCNTEVKGGAREVLRVIVSEPYHQFKNAVPLCGRHGHGGSKEVFSPCYPKCSSSGGTSMKSG